MYRVYTVVALLNGVTAITAVCTHARTHARTHEYTHTHTHTQGWLGAMVRNHFDSLVAPFDLAVVFLIGLFFFCNGSMMGLF